MIDAVKQGDIAKIASLTQAGPSNVRNDAGQTPLAIARSHGHAEVVELLHQHDGVE